MPDGGGEEKQRVRSRPRRPRWGSVATVGHRRPEPGASVRLRCDPVPPVGQEEDQRDLDILATFAEVATALWCAHDGPGFLRSLG